MDRYVGELRERTLAETTIPLHWFPMTKYEP